MSRGSSRSVNWPRAVRPSVDIRRPWWPVQPRSISAVPRLISTLAAATGSLGALDRLQITLPLDAPVGQAGVSRIVIRHLVDDDGRRDLHGNPVAAGAAIARRQIIRMVLLQAEIARRQPALEAVIAFGLGHGNDLIDALPVGRAVDENHRLTRPQAG